MKKHLLSLLFITFSFLALSQKTEKINSREVIAQGVKLHEDEKYKDAIKKFALVSRNDTNYVLALYEKAYSYVADSNFTEALNACNEGLKQDNDEYELPLLILKGSILDDTGDSRGGIEIYDSALAKYPNSQNLMLNKAVSLLRLLKLDEAEKLLQDLLVRNPFHASAHFRLAQVEIKKGQIIPSMMCLYTYLINNPSGPYTSNVIKVLDNFSKVTDDVTELINTRKLQPEGNIALVEQIILSKIALDPQYKVLTDLDDPIIRQLQVMMEKLNYESDNDDFFMQFYVPYLKDIFNKKLFEPAVFYAFSNVDIEKIKRYVKKNEKEINEATKAIATNLIAIRSTRELNYVKRQKLQTMYHYEDGKLIAKGLLEKEEPVDKWEFYFQNGNIKSTGKFNRNGEKDGKWTYYFENGSINGYDNWNNGKQEGEDLIFNKKGILTTKSNYSKGLMQGEKTSYFPIGTTYSITTYKDDKEDGRYIQYYTNGRKKIEANTVADELSGPYLSFYENGKTEVISSYTKGKLDGNYKSYYDNGQLEFDGVYKSGELVGLGTTFHTNGKIKRTAHFVNGLLEGEEKEFNDQDVVIKKIFYKKGKADGTANYFDDDGKLFSTFQFDNDKLKVAKYFDKTGKEISTSTRQNKIIELTSYTSEGFKSFFVVYNDEGNRQKKDSYFYTSGNVKETNSYKDGMLDGISLGYFPNGKTEYEISYEKNKKNGASRYYYLNGQLKSENWYVNGLLNGDWIEYNEYGKITSLTTYLNDDIYGTRQTFFANSKLDDEVFYTSGWVSGLQQFDTLGNVIYSSKLVKGTGTYKSIFPNGKTRYEGKFVDGELHGMYTNYFFDGSTSAVKTYNHGLLDGDYTEYNYGGKVSFKGAYSLGKRTGIWKFYYSDGGILREESFINGQQEGMFTYYFPDGKIEREIMFRNNERDGFFKRYAHDGQLALISYYKDDVIVSYTYNDKSGKLVPTIAVPGGNGNVVGYFSNGNKSVEMKFVDGKLQGPYKMYFPNGKIYYEEENQEYGHTIGKLKEYYPNGSIKTDYSYYYDNPEGIYKEYYDNGKMKEEGTYNNGTLNGSRKFYDINGKLTGKWEYYFGLLLNATK